jgi:hypothetical protein
MMTIDANLFSAVEYKPNDPVQSKDAMGPRLKALRETIDTTIGSVFLGTLMRQMRSSSLKGEIGHGGRGEEIFRGQLDQILIEGAGLATSYAFGDAMFERFKGAAMSSERAQGS